MAKLVGGIKSYLGVNNRIDGTSADDVIFGEPHAIGSLWAVLQATDFLSS